MITDYFTLLDICEQNSHPLINCPILVEDVIILGLWMVTAWSRRCLLRSWSRVTRLTGSSAVAALLRELSSQLSGPSPHRRLSYPDLAWPVNKYYNFSKVWSSNCISYSTCGYLLYPMKSFMSYLGFVRVSLVSSLLFCLCCVFLLFV